LLFLSTEHREKLCFIPGRNEKYKKYYAKRYETIFGRRTTYRNSIIALNYGTVDGQFEFPYCIQLIYNSEEQVPMPETAETSSKSILNMMNIDEEKNHQFLDIC